jgi:ferredoxin
LTTSDNVFEKLSAMVGAPGSSRFPKVLEAMMTAEEAQLLLELKTPATAEQLAVRLKVDPHKLKTQLEDMEYRQIIRKNPLGYVTPPNIVAFHHGSIGWLREDLKSKVYPLWGDFFFAEWRDIIVDEFERRKKTGAPGGHRVVPAHKALKASPNIKLEQILWYEDMEQVLRRSERNSLMMCGCRGLWRKCDHPIDVCLQVQLPAAGERRRTEAHDFLKPPKDVTFEEALAVVDECEDRGLVHIPLNTSYGDLYCNCCDDCCMVINPLLHRGNLHDILTPSRYRAVIDLSLCTGCQKCVERCIFSAIEMQKTPGSKKLKSKIVNEHCMGCGACVLTCPAKALTLELVRPPEHIPTVPVIDLLRWQRKEA